MRAGITIMYLSIAARYQQYHQRYISLFVLLYHVQCMCVKKKIKKIKIKKIKIKK